MLDELLLLSKIRNNDLKAFEKLFRNHYAPLCRYANSYLNDLPVAEEIVQDLFFLLWKEREQLKIRLSLKSYLYQAARNRAFHYLRHVQVEENYKEKAINGFIENETSTPIDELEYKELEAQLSISLKRMPERQCKIFCMSRFDGKKYSEIAQELSVSVKTVEAEMTKALALLRKELKHFTNTQTSA
ncbi:MAG: polymerase ECF-type sigma factor [Bacteroidetes bacterium]|jgi:RNA polymerase sigma-70 factor, ECF subfamily|nr:polymerase ECF-type sigma factor [Bacteroidota bacterium]